MYTDPAPRNATRLVPRRYHALNRPSDQPTSSARTCVIATNANMTRPTPHIRLYGFRRSTKFLRTIAAKIALRIAAPRETAAPAAVTRAGTSPSDIELSCLPRRVLHELEEDPTGALRMDECDLAAARALAGDFVDHRQPPGARPRHCRLNVVDRERDVMDALAAVLEE